MKKLITPLAIAIVSFLFCFAQCKKNRVDSNGLPPATQEGKNTFGFLLNGQPWTPQGFNGTANLSINYDATFSAGVFNLGTYRTLNVASGTRQRITMYGDSIQMPQKIILPNPDKFGMIFRNDVSGCDYDIADTTIKIESGYFDIQKLDKINGIFSGEFEIEFTKTGCENIEISKGRFDMKF